MKRCPITYDILHGEETYSSQGLKTLSPQLKTLAPLNYSAAEQRHEAIVRAGKMSIQGVQSKLSAQLKVKEGYFEIVDQGGHYILKPQSELYPELPENEGLTMSLAAMINIPVPVHGLVYSNDGSMTYFIKRFDRKGHTQKVATEDFAQLSQSSRDTKYNSSMEKVANLLAFCTFPQIEAVELFKRTLFNFLVGNEDMHLKNFSLITQDNITQLTPAYDLLNTTIALKHAKEEFALPINGKKHQLRRQDLIDYFAFERLQLNNKTVNDILDAIKQTVPAWKILIEKSFLSPLMQQQYLALLEERLQRINLKY